VETYVQWNDAAQEEYDALLAEEENREVTTMEMTWADRIRLEGQEIGLEKGREEGREKGREEGRVEGMRALVAELIESRFGEVSADRRRRLEAIGSTEELMRLADRLLVARSLDDLGI
jgi:predicted transposase YdaD